MDNPRLELLRKKTHLLPKLPGVYIMRDQKGKIIYIGKAKSLKNRVTSYFRSVDKHHPKVYRMVEQVYNFDYIVTDSEFEALMLECSMIKQNMPKYNILLKDGKGYFYIKIEKKPWGKITAEKNRLDSDCEYIGPYLSFFVVQETVDEANKIFMLPTCSRRFPEDFGKGRPCLNFHLKQCMAPCTGRVSKEDYSEAVAQARGFMKDGGKLAQEQLTQKMQQAAENMEFEKAARYRDRISAIVKISEHQKVVWAKVSEQDVIGFAQTPQKCCVVILKFRGSRLVDKEFFMLGQTEDLPVARSEFLVRYYDERPDIPRQITLDGETEDKELISAYLTAKAGHKVELSLPQKGEQMKLVEMAKGNSAEHLAEQSGRTGKELTALDELGRLLGLQKPPEYIEAYDISNIGTETIVAGMVVFDNGRPLKAAYRKFSITEVQGKPDDYASMREVLRRRLERYTQHKEEGVGFGRLPDLILLDGGKGHVSTVEPVIREMGFSIPVFGLVKDDRHRTRAIATGGEEISITSTRSAFTLLGTIQEEVHRFSITYSRSKHRKSSLELSIQEVEGMGPKRVKEVFSYFKTIKKMKEATVEELCAVPSMTKQAAENLWHHLHR